MLGKIVEIKQVYDFECNVNQLNGSNGSRLGMCQMLNSLTGTGSKDGYKIVTDKHTWMILIDNDQSCCEDWGYMSSDDDFNRFIGKEILEVKLADTALKTQMLKDFEYGFDGGGIQFVDFIFSDDVLQFAVYNAHNGYYGHDIIIAQDDDILKSDVL